MADTATLPLSEQPPLRRRLRFDEFIGAVEAGVFGRDARVELVDGEIVEMSPQSTAHFQLKARLARVLTLQAGGAWMTFSEPTIQIADSTGLEPDIAVFALADAQGALDPAKAALVVEIAVSSLDYDLGPKASLYARAGVAEYWVLDVERSVAHIFRVRVAESWAAPMLTSFSEALSPQFAPAITLRISDL